MPLPPNDLVAVGASAVLTITRHGVTVRFPDVPGATETPYVYRPLTKGGWYEERFLEHIRSRRRRGIYVDVGAHLGTHTAWFAMLCPAEQVHALEPVARFADQVQAVVAANRLANVTVHRVGVSDCTGFATNQLTAEHQTGFHPAGEAKPTTEDFPVTTLDRLLGRKPVAVVKLDIEGMEEAALRGAARILSRYRPLVYVEAHDDERLAGVKRVLAAHDYRATGRVFNASPTYEFEVSPNRRAWFSRPLNWWGALRS